MRKVLCDKHGNIISIGNNVTDLIENTLQYDNNRLAKKTVSRYDDFDSENQLSLFNTSEYTYTYKKIRVPIKYVDTVLDQQWKIINSYSEFTTYLVGIL